MNPEHSVNFKDLWCSKGTQELREGLSQGNWAHLTAHLRPGPASGPALPPAPTPPTATAQAQCLRAVSRSGLTRASRGALGSGCAASDRLWRERMTPRGTWAEMNPSYTVFSRFWGSSSGKWRNRLASASAMARRDGRRTCAVCGRRGREPALAGRVWWLPAVVAPADLP